MNSSASLDPFLELVAKSGLLPPERLVRFAAPASPKPRDALAARLVADGLLTPYQARLLLNGWYRNFFIAEKYKILDLLGEGGMGRVYLCEQTVLERLVAVKQLQLDSEAIPGAAARFLREAVAVAALDHPNIARIHDADRCINGAFLVMEAVDGLNLHQLTARLGQLPVGRAAGLIRQAALGLQHAHERGLVHRDVKPGNLMVDRAGMVKVLDLGLARFFDASRNHDLTGRFDTRRALGTAEFMAPEQALNSSEVDTRADIYSLGGALYFLLLGRFPYEKGTALEKLHRHQTEPFDPVGPQRPEVPAGLVAVLDRMVAKRPEDRYQNPAAAAAALKPYASAPEPLTEAEHATPSGYLLGLTTSSIDLVLGLGSSVGASTPVRGQSGLSTTVVRHFDRIPYSVGAADVPTGVVAAVDPPAPRRRAVIPLAGLIGVAVVAAAGGALGTRLTGGAAREVEAPTRPTPVKVALAGAGSTLARPLFAEVRAAPNVGYTANGSARGVRRMIEQVTDFAVTDVPLTDEQVRGAAQVGGPVTHVPLSLSAVAISHNLPGVPGPLNFTGPLLADIYLGKVTRWDDPAIRAVNPRVNLPALPVTVVRREDGSGPTAIFTDYLSRVSATWAEQVGSGTEPRWPATTDGPPKVLSAKGNMGAADALSRTPGAIGYLDATDALATGLPLDEVMNRAGEPVGPTLVGVVAAMQAREAEVPDDLRFSLADAPGRDSYPLAGVVWVVSYTKQPAAKAGPLRDFLRGILLRGPASLQSLGCTPLPDGLRAKSLAAVEALGEQ